MGGLRGIKGPVIFEKGPWGKVLLGEGREGGG